MGKAVNACMNSCGTIFPCCPGLRSKSKVPGKRYKKLLADIFPKSPDASPNDRKIGKLAEYAARNPMRVPKIANSLEVRGVKELRSERFGYVTIVMRTYSKLLSSCQDQMPLFATSALSMIQTLLRHRKDEMQILACNTFVDFVKYQKDSAYIHQCDHFLPAMVALAHETGPEERRNPLRAAGLAGIGEMLWFMASVTHISPGFKEIVTAVLDNVALPSALHQDDEDDGNNSPGPVDRAVAAVKDAYEKIKDKNRGVHIGHGEKDPGDVAQYCVQNMARLAKEVTTARTVLDPAFQYFDTGKHWASEEGLAYKVLRTMQKTMTKDKSHQRSALLLNALTRHLGTLTRPDSKASILLIFIRLVNKGKSRVEELTLVHAMGEITRHLRRSLEASEGLEHQEGASDATQEALKKELDFQATAREALEALVKKVSDPSAILELMASIFEKLTGPPPVARSTVRSMLALAKVTADLVGPPKEVFPESMLTQLLQIMMFPDAETRVLAHHVLATLLPGVPLYGRPERKGGLLKTQSGMPLRKEGELGKRKEKEKDEKDGKRKGKIEEEEESPAMSRRSSEDGTPAALPHVGSGRHGINLMHSLSSLGKHKKEESREPSAHGAHPEKTRRRSHSKDGDMHLSRFSGHQACLLLSSLWLQSLLPDNEPANFEAMAFTYSAVVSFTLPKTKSHSPMIQAVRLTVSLRALSLSTPLDEPISTSQARSLFTLSTAMLASAAKAYGFSHITPALLHAYDKLKDERCPWLDLADNERLIVSSRPPLDIPDAPKPAPYGSQEDQALAARVWPPNPSVNPELDREAPALASKIATTAGFLELEGPALESQLLEPFVPEDHYALRPREFDTRIVAPTSPLNSALLRSESLEGDGLVMSPANPMDEAMGALPRSVSVASTQALESGIPSAEALLQQAEDIATSNDAPSTRGSTIAYGELAGGMTSATDSNTTALDLLVKLGIRASNVQSPAVTKAPAESWKPTISPASNTEAAEAPTEIFMQKGVEVPVTRSVKELRKSFAGPEKKSGVNGSVPVGEPAEESLFDVMPKEPWEMLSLPPTSAYDQLTRAGVIET